MSVTAASGNANMSTLLEQMEELLEQLEQQDLQSQQNEAATQNSQNSATPQPTQEINIQGDSSQSGNSAATWLLGFIANNDPSHMGNSSQPTSSQG